MKKLLALVIVLFVSSGLLGFTNAQEEKVFMGSELNNNDQTEGSWVKVQRTTGEIEVYYIDDNTAFTEVDLNEAEVLERYDQSVFMNIVESGIDQTTNNDMEIDANADETEDVEGYNTAIFINEVQNNNEMKIDVDLSELDVVENRNSSIFISGMENASVIDEDFNVIYGLNKIRDKNYILYSNFSISLSSGDVVSYSISELDGKYNVGVRNNYNGGYNWLYKQPLNTTSGSFTMTVVGEFSFAIKN
ncbi:MAG: hypothetical protein ACK5LY_06760 [Lachnospirales bacterium]